MNAPNIVEIFRVDIGDGAPYSPTSIDTHYFVSRHTDLVIARKELARHREETRDKPWVDFCLKAPIE